MNLNLWLLPGRRGLGTCPGLPSSACRLEHFPTVIRTRNGILLCSEYETYFGLIPRQDLSQDSFPFWRLLDCCEGMCWPGVVNEALPFRNCWRYPLWRAVSGRLVLVNQQAPGFVKYLVSLQWLQRRIFVPLLKPFICISLNLVFCKTDLILNYKWA